MLPVPMSMSALISGVIVDDKRFEGDGIFIGFGDGERGS